MVNIFEWIRLLQRYYIIKSYNLPIAPDDWDIISWFHKFINFIILNNVDTIFKIFLCKF